jgi:hypothetical protein
MPVTARLSSRFYEKFGDEIAAEFVNWFNEVDATYRGDLRQLNELNFARFDARVGERFADLEVRLERRFAELEGKWERRTGALETYWEQRLSDVRADLVRWMFVFWAGNVVTTLGIVLALR